MRFRWALFGLLACGEDDPPDHGACPDYSASSQALGNPTASIEATYGDDGQCWSDAPTTPTGEDQDVLCRAECADALQLLAESGPDVLPECGGEPQGTIDTDPTPEPSCA